MQLLLSCAKTMDENVPAALPHPTAPAFGAEADTLALRAAALTNDELARVLRVSRRLAVVNSRRFREFHSVTPHAALLSYTGIVFRHIAPQHFSPSDFEYAQRHLNITSFLYGLLRPLDAIRPYRLEGDAVLPGNDDRTLFEFWRERLTAPLLERVRADDGVLVNLASGEMKRLFDWERIRREVRVVTPEFRIREGDRLKTVVVYTKMCRGEMTRHILRNRIAAPEALKAFEWEGFRFDAACSRDDTLVFTL